MWPHAVSPKAAARLLPSSLMNSALGRYSLLLVQHAHSQPRASLVKSFVRRLVRVQRLQQGFRAYLKWIFPELVLTGPADHMGNRIFKISKS